MDVLLCLYPQYANFQIGHLLFFLKKIGHAQITTATVNGEPVESLGGLKVNPDTTMLDMDVSTYDLILLPGGDGVDDIANHSHVISLLQASFGENVPIAAMCASAVLLGQAGLLNDRKFTCNPQTYENYQVDFGSAKYTGKQVEMQNNITTAKGTAFIDFTIVVGNMIGLWRNQQDIEHARAFCLGHV